MTESTVILKTLGKRIATLRKKQGMNQEEFADVSGKMINTISNIERGLSDPKVTILLSLAEALNVPVDSLFNDDKRPQIEELPENVQAIVKLIKNQDTRTLKTIQKQIEALLELMKAWFDRNYPQLTEKNETDKDNKSPASCEIQGVKLK